MREMLYLVYWIDPCITVMCCTFERLCILFLVDLVYQKIPVIGRKTDQSVQYFFSLVWKWGWRGSTSAIAKFMCEEQFEFLFWWGGVGVETENVETAIDFCCSLIAVYISPRLTLLIETSDFYWGGWILNPPTTQRSKNSAIVVVLQFLIGSCCFFSQVFF